MTPKYYKEYRKVERLESEVFSAKNPWVFLTGMRQAGNSIKTCLKCKWVLDKIKEGKKTVIYSSFVSLGLEKMQALLKKENISYAEITGKVSKSQRSQIVNEYNKNKVKVLFITKAGAEGLDLKGTRYVIIFESLWNRAAENQIIGRAVRYKSHIDLPKKERKVTAYHLVIVKPGNLESTDKHLESADQMLRTHTDKKLAAHSQFLKKIYPLSIEQRKKCK